MTIHRAGHKVILVFMLVLALLQGLISWIPSLHIVLEIFLRVALVGLGLLVLWFFRIPKRPYTGQPGEVTAVSDGKVVLVEEVDEPEVIGGRAIKICVFLSIFDVHAQWAPVAGTLEYFKYHKGEYLVAWHEKSSTLNERTTFGQRTPGGMVVWRQIAGAVARRIRWYVKEGDEVSGGQECGFILFGSRIDFYLPLEAQVTVKPGDRVVARSTVLARLPEVS
ncbi:phosphatidylserine decarboxylase family protein [Flavobacteriales bacterium]|jgi:phosphatidylserine decarboxylase|nr:phosphatidylserine decarboxylase family protein [Flavobacteriales bacterium]